MLFSPFNLYCNCAEQKNAQEVNLYQKKCSKIKTASTLGNDIDH